ncbi:FecR family protein [Mucilaginibacter kameinonensis]|uniref:FecR family protein n=1 Tax=Mucilaginibacter kameinonensis TaxID=452286 RepID=UPI000EF7B990|nr:FecR family protein [Mucilaginibacter kameinonensis]
MEKEQLKVLFKKYHEGTCTEEEKTLLESWYLQYNEHEVDLPARKIAAIGKRIFRELPGNESSFLRIGVVITLAAVLIGLLISVTVKLVFDNPSEKNITAVHDIPPGSNKAILTLAGGKRIDLNRAANGRLATQGGIQIVKNANGQLTYRNGETTTVDETLSNTITTPNSGQWFVALPDGTKVWLNNASSFTYPASFAHQKERIVQLNGEAYFEVAKDKAHPFIVRTGQQEIRVLGTHFNVNAFTDELSVRTTLLEGSVRVMLSARQAAKILSPGQQSLLAGNSLTIRAVDPQQAIAWKNGYFRFNNEKIQSIMRQLSRWYDIEVRYEGPVPTEAMNGKVSRYKNISQVLKALEATGTVRFKAEGRRVTVMK